MCRSSTAVLQNFVFRICISAVVACVETPTGPLHVRPPAPSRSVAGPLGSYPIPIAPTNAVNGGALLEQGTGIYIPDNSTVTIMVTGNVDLAKVPGYSGNVYIDDAVRAGQSIPPWGVYDHGTANGQLQVTLPNAANPAPGLDSILITMHVNTGFELHVARNGIPGGQTCLSPGGEVTCDSLGNTVSSFAVAGGYKLTSNQTITVTRLEDDVTLTAVVSTGAKGRSVTFTPHADYPGGAMNWTWTPDSGSAQTAACSYGANPCITNVYESGWMDVYYQINAHDGQPAMARHAKAHVTTVDCPTGDSLLDRPDFRKLFAQIYDSAGPTLPFTQRREYGGWLYLNPNTDTLIYKPFSLTGATPCSLNVTPYDTTVSPAWLIAIPHAHPADTGTVVPPGVCPQAPLGGYVGRGPSDHDDALAVSQLLPVYAVDSKTIYRTTGPGQHAEWPRVSACTIF
jgi:hypothetical protein